MATASEGTRPGRECRGQNRDLSKREAARILGRMGPATVTENAFFGMKRFLSLNSSIRGLTRRGRLQEKVSEKLGPVSATGETPNEGTQRLSDPGDARSNRL
jgi:hypothetical protein